ncbi:hypothetical protein NUW54_g12376 [Trametes sanguinea]|uniref:Uncharacterized protein n=1 Tax=Trametes sanguinea TaxID=158606 RepID=A0ACC1MY49_9APHY|nr:hypothetical protein NUW54_g12376 [Trametes sanguinea]
MEPVPTPSRWIHHRREDPMDTSSRIIELRRPPSRPGWKQNVACKCLEVREVATRALLAVKMSNLRNVHRGVRPRWQHTDLQLLGCAVRCSGEQPIWAADRLGPHGFPNSAVASLEAAGREQDFTEHPAKGQKYLLLRALCITNCRATSASYLGGCQSEKLN